MKPPKDISKPSKDMKHPKNKDILKPSKDMKPPKDMYIITLKGYETS